MRCCASISTVYDVGKGYQDTTEDAARFEIAGSIWFGNFKEAFAESRGNEDAAEVLSIFEVRYGQHCHEIRGYSQLRIAESQKLEQGEASVRELVDQVIRVSVISVEEVVRLVVISEVERVMLKGVLTVAVRYQSRTVVVAVKLRGI